MVWLAWLVSRAVTSGSRPVRAFVFLTIWVPAWPPPGRFDSARGAGQPPVRMVWSGPRPAWALEFQKTLRVPASFLQDGRNVARGVVPALLAGQVRARTSESCWGMNQVPVLRPTEVPAGVHGAVQMSVQRASLIGRLGATRAASGQPNVATVRLSARSEQREALHVAAV
jgi:hypothetical protein